MIVLGILGKFGALFSTIPDPVVGGVFCCMSVTCLLLVLRLSWDLLFQTISVKTRKLSTQVMNYLYNNFIKFKIYKVH